MAIELGFWAIPLGLTIICMIIANNYRKPTGGGYFGSFDIEGLFRFGMAIIGSLVAWLIYALAT